MTEEGKVLLEKPLEGAEEIKTTIKTEQKKSFKTPKNTTKKRNAIRS